MKSILVVDDEPRIAELARDYLEHAGFAVRIAGTGDDALESVRRDRPDLVVLDLGLPGLDGLDVTREIRRESNLPVIMLTARDDELDKLLGLELGADDYLTKPFSPRELVARVRAVLRRVDAGSRPAEDVLRVGDLTLDVPRMRAQLGDRTIELTATEFALLADAGASAGPDLHAVAAARCGSWGGVRVVRAGDRHAHQEHPAKARARSATAESHPDGLRRRLSIRRRPSVSSASAGRPSGPRRPPWAPKGARPPWWPTGTKPGPRAVVGMAAASAACSASCPSSAIVGFLVRRRSPRRRGRLRTGPGGHVVRLAAALAVLAVVVGLARASRVIRRSGRVLDDLVDQAARLESGDYAARVQLTRPAPPPVADLVRGFNTMAARLEANERQRRTLIADVTHELRTPLTVIAGNVEAILDGVHPADDAHLATILEETRVLSRLVEDLRTLALSEAGSLSLHREPTDLEVLCTDVARRSSPRRRSWAPRSARRLRGDVPLVDVDPVRIREVLGNLVGNALRHTPAGGTITIEARRAPLSAPMTSRARGEPEAQGAIQIVVRDTGSGIDPALLPHVFERFTRGSGSTGTGLGLSIARSLVELHGGSIAAGSRAGGGTEITIVLPVGGR